MACVGDVAQQRPLAVDPATVLMSADSVLEFATEYEVRLIRTLGARSDSSPARRLKMTRRRDPRGGWLTVIHHASATWAVTATSDSLPASIELSDLHGGVVVRNAKGDALSLPSASSQTPMDAASPSATKYIPPVFRTSPAARTPSGKAGDPNAWLGSLVYRAGSGESARALLAAGASRATARGGYDRYVLPLASRLLEVSIDPGSGMVVEENLIDQQKLVARTQYGYQTIRGGDLVRTYSRHETADPGGGSGRRTIEIRLINPVLRRVSGDYQ
ncbi:MAG: hypothetical protein IT361_09495 [Gemmatimonadaceae bacterium]|nr:hypothetical protein [Gemmatimonadaceae bacterium]